MKRLGLVPLALALISLAIVTGPVEASAAPLLVNIYNCDQAGHAMSIAHNRSLYLNYGWQTKTKNQTLKYLASATTIVKIDGVTVANADSYWSPPYKDSSGFWNVAWLYQTAKYALGQSRTVTLQTKFSTQIFDGFDHYGPGKEFHPALSCTITGS